MNWGFDKDFYSKGNSVKRSGHSVNRRTLKTEKLLSSSPSTENQLLKKTGLKPNVRGSNTRLKVRILQRVSHIVAGSPETPADRKRGRQKGATSKSVKIFSTLFDSFRAGKQLF